MTFHFIVLCELMIELFFFSCIGWLMAVTLKYIQYHRFINRGYLIGPYCPIYGCGVVAVTVLVGGVIGYEGSITDTFLAGFIICGILEYFVSWYMEKMFHARWWDYSTKPMNLHGRIWIGNLVLFGVGSVIVMKWIDPIFFTEVEKWPKSVVILSAVFVTVLLITDNIVSYFLMNVVKKEIDGSEADNTEEISQKVRALLKNRKALLRRIQAAYPDMQARPEALTRQLKEARREVKEAAARVKQATENLATEKIKKTTEMIKEAAGKVKETKISARSNLEEEINKAVKELGEAKEKLLKIEERLNIKR